MTNEFQMRKHELEMIKTTYLLMKINEAVLESNEDN